VLLASSIFLIPNGTFFAELILFLIVLGVVGTVILPPIRKTLAEREHMVRSSLEAGEEGRVEADRLSAEAEAILSGARAEARSRFDEAAQSNEQRRAEARIRAEQERARQLAEATGRLEAERARARAEAMRDVESLVVTAAERVLGRPVDRARHAKILNEVAAEVSATTEGSSTEVAAAEPPGGGR